MSFRYLPTTLLLTATLLATGCSRESNPATSEEPPSIFLISIDTLRADRLPAWGYRRVETPAIDRLARDGILFENAYAQVPLTLPSHASLLSGRHPYEIGLRSNIGYHLEAETGSTLPEILASQGYATGAAVSAYVLRGETGLASLFDHYDDTLDVFESATLGELQRDGQTTVTSALAWLDRTKDRPLFLFLHLFEPHTPYEPVEPFRSRYDDPYEGEIATVDAIVGRFLQELDKRGLYESSAIVIISDHGEGLGDHGEKEHGVLLYRESIHVPIVVKLPGSRLSGTRVAAPAQLVDLLPTLAEIGGATFPGSLPGVSLIDLAEGRAPEDRAIYSETLYPRLHLGWSELRSMTDGRHHYIEGPEPELYDVIDDPGERRNIREARRREGHALAGLLESIPLNLQSHQSGDSEEKARLAALGYLSGPAPERGGGRLNPRDHIEVLGRVQAAFDLYEAARYEESVGVCRRILLEYPDLVDVQMQLAASLRQLGRTEDALETYKEAVRVSPQLLDSTVIEMAQLELDLGNLDSAVLHAQQAMKLNPQEARLVLAEVELNRGNTEAAEREARLAIGSDARPGIAPLIVLARVLVARGRLQEAHDTVALADARLVTDDLPPVRTLASTRGDILARMGRLKEAEDAFREEIAQFPVTRDAYLRLAILLASQHRFAEIKPTLDAMVESSPGPTSLRLAATAMEDLGNHQAAAEYRARADDQR